jgi:WD40 repeat protein
MIAAPIAFADLMGSLFVSYSSEDRARVRWLCDWLTEQGFISLFLDVDEVRGLAIGDKWESQLYAQLRRTDAVLFAGSPASVASRWCFAELAMARSLGKRVFPVVLRAGGSHPLLDDTQAVDLTAGAEAGLERLRLALAVPELDPERTFDWDPRRSPFPGLEPFDERDAAVFFGRQADTERLLAQLRSSRRRHTGRLLAVVGASGSGKSSLVRAGVLPRLRRAEPPWAVLAIDRPGDQPMRALARAVVDAFRDAGEPLNQASVELTLGDGAAGLVGLASRLSDLLPGVSRPVLVFIDQAEELVGPGDDVSHLLELLYEATRGPGPLWALVTVRLESLGAFIAEARLIFDDQLLVGPLDDARLAEVIERPADRAGMRLAPGLVGRMVGDAGGGDALPLLAYTLAELYQLACARRSTTITLADYDSLGGVVGALGRSADEQFARLTRRGLGDLVLPTLNRLATVGLDGQLLRRRIALAALDEQRREVVDAFVDARLLTSTQLDGEAVVEVAHEALLRQWPPLTQTIEREREAKQRRAELERAALEWDRTGRRDEYLLAPERLSLAATDGSREDLDAIEHAFLTLSEARAAARRQAQRRRTRLVLAGMTVALAVVTTLAVVSLIQSGVANDQRRLAEARSLAVASTEQLPRDPELALLLATEAARRAHKPEIEDVLRNALQSPIRLSLRGQVGAIRDAELSRDGRHAVTTSNVGVTRLWDLRNARGRVISGQRPADVGSAGFSPDGKLVFTSGVISPLRLWDAETGRAAGPPLRVHHEHAVDAAFSDDSRRLLSWNNDGSVVLWNVVTRRRVRLVRPPVKSRTVDRSPVHAALSPDGRLAALASERGLEIRYAESGAPVWRRDGDYATVTFDRRGQRLLTTDHFDFERPPRAPPAVRVWSVNDGSTIGRLTSSDLTLSAEASFLGDGRRVLTNGRLWDPDHDRVSSLGKAANPFDDPGPDIEAAGPDGRRVAVASTSRVVIWDAASRRRLARLPADTSPVTALSIGPDGRTVLTGHSDGSIELWDPRVVALDGAQRLLPAVAVSPRSRRIAGLTRRFRLRLWDAATGRIVGRPRRALRGCFQVNESCTAALQFSADGRHLHAVLDNVGQVVTPGSAKRTSTTFITDAFGPLLTFSEDGRRVAIGQDEATGRRSPVIVRDVATGDVVSRMETEVPGGLSLSADGGILGVNSTLFVRLWNTATGREQRIVLADTDLTESITEGHPGSDLALSRDGSRAVAGLGDGSAVLFNAGDRKEPVRFFGRRDEVPRVRFSPDERYVVTSWSPGRTEIHRASDGHLIAAFAGAGAVAMTGDDRRLVIVGQDGAGLLHTCDACASWPELVKRAEQRAVRELTPAERARFLGG